MRILFVSAEVAPFAKVGGLADVIGSLPLALAALGHDVRVVMPLYGSISFERYNLQMVISQMNVQIGHGDTSTAVFESRLPTQEGGPQVPIYFIQNQHHFERERVYGYDDDGDRFVVFCRGALTMLHMLNWKPDIIHANDWHTGLIPAYLKTVYSGDWFLSGVKSAFTIHNLAYQGIFDKSWLRQTGLERLGIVWGDRDGMVNIMGRGIAYADAVSTVSPTYASEILTPEYGEDLDWLLNYRWGHLWGILNGIDYNVYNPATDRQISSNYDHTSIEKRAANKFDLQQRLNLPREANIPIIGMISRLANQKGFDLVVQAADRLLEKNVQLVVLGTGEPQYHDFLGHLAQRYAGKVTSVLAFDTTIAQKIYAGSDFFLMPSRFEPCGLGQLIAMRYGSIPIVRHTGGLVDTVQEYNPDANYGNGFVFGPYEAVHMLSAIDRALAVYARPEEWRNLIRLNMERDYSWEASARQYLDFYHHELHI